VIIIVRKTLLILFFLSIFFPYLSFGIQIGSDQQPWPVFVGLAFLLLQIAERRRLAFGKDFLLVIALIIVQIGNLSAFFLFEGADTLDFFRSVYKYLSFLIIIIVVSSNFKYLEYKYVKISILVWAFVSNVQAIIKLPIVSSLLPRVSYYPSRNLAIGLSPEPSFLAKMMIFFILSSSVYYTLGRISKSQRLMMDIVCLEVILLSQSLSGYILVLGYYFVIILVNCASLLTFYARRIRLNRIIAVFIALSVVLVFSQFLSDALKFFFSGRAAFLLRLFGEGSEDLLDILLSDRSFSGRMIHIFSPMNTLSEGRLLGNGILDYSTGGLLSVITENGILGVVFLASILLLEIRQYLRNAVRSDARKLILVISVFLPFLIFTDTIASPIFPSLVAIQYAMSNILSEKTEQAKSISII